MSSTRGDPGSNRATNGSSISLYLEGVTIDTGRGNPGAKALEYHANNVGRLENVVLRSGDAAGVLGLDLTHHDVGPALVKRVRIEGFNVGVAIRYQEYSMTFEHLTLVGQRLAGIRASKPSRSYPLVFVPYLTELQARQLLEQQVSGLDLCGNAVLIVPGELLVLRTGAPNRFPRSGRIKNVYRRSSSIVARALLLITLATKIINHG